MERSSGLLALLGTLSYVSYPAELKITLTRRTDGTRFIGNKAKAQTGMSVPPETCWVGPFLNSPLSLKIYCALSCAHRPALLEALPTKYRPPLCGTERNCGFLPALRAVCLRFRAHRRGVTSAATSALGPFGLATFAALRFVFEALVGEKHLFAGGKNEFSATFRTLQHFVVVFHEPLSPGPVWGRRLGGLCT